MKYFVAIIGIAALLSACGKDKFTTDPQITFNSIKPNNYAAGTNISVPGPKLSIQLKDLEGDFRFEGGVDTSYVYVKNVTVAPFTVDSFPFPASTNIKRNNLNAEVVVDLKEGRVLYGSSTPPRLPYVDTLYFDVYVQDIGKHKSNVIRTSDPVFYLTQ